MLNLQMSILKPGVKVIKCIVWLLAFCLMLNNFAVLSVAYAEGATEDIYKYDFKKDIKTDIGDIGENGWIVQECTSGYRHQEYGLQVHTDSVGDYIKFAVDIPENGFYTVKFTGAGAGGGAISDITVDDIYVGTFDFYSGVYQPAKPSLSLKTLELEAGIHYISIEAISKADGSWGYNMYPGEVEFIKKEALPSLVSIDADSDRSELAVGQTAEITAKGIMSDGYVDLFRDDDVVLEYISSAADVASVKANGIVKALKAGRTDITVQAMMNGITREAVIPITVNGKVLTTVELQLERNDIPEGKTIESTIIAKLNDGSLIDLEDAIVEYSSSNEDVAIVDENGNVKAVGEGEAVISAKVTLGNTTVTGEADLHVAPVQLDAITVEADKTSLFVGHQAALTITGRMNDATDADLSNASISYYTYRMADGEPVEDNEIAEIKEEAEGATVTALQPGVLKVVVEVNLDGIVRTNEVIITIESTEGITGSKTKSTYYSEEKVAAARENIEKYDWARAIRDSAVELADLYVDKAEMLWNMVPPQSIPRSITVNPQYTCPNCKADLRAKYGNYPWIADPMNEPWKLKCPNCSTQFPTNDFESYYKGGLDSHGIFDPELAKQHDDELIASGEKGNLVNELYPEKGLDWGVEDGYGWIAEDGVKQTFIAYYAHWSLWYSGVIHNAINALRDAYIYTGDVRYARTGTILLDRIADVYPDMDLEAYKDSDGYRNSHGGTAKGKIIGCIWETGLVQALVKAYDAFFPAMDDPEIIDFLMQKSAELDLDNPKSTGGLIRKNIEDGLIRQVYPGVKNAQIRGNFGMHQAALALAAVVLDSNPETKEWLDFNFQAGGLESNPWRVTGGDIMATLADRVDRDGHGNEASPEYNKIWLDQILEVANILDGYEGYPEADLYKNPKFMKMFSAGCSLILAGKYTAQIGDSGSTGNTGLHADLADAVTGFLKFGDPVLAQLAYFLNNNSVEGLHGNIFMNDPESIGQEIQKVIDEHGKFNLKTDNQAGYGFAALRDGEDNKQYFGIQIPFAGLNAFDTTTGYKYFEASGTIQFEADKAGHKISFKFDVPKTDVYEFNILPFRAASYGIYDVYMDGEKVNTIDFYGGSGANSKLEALAVMELTEGEHVITFEGVGKSENATGYKMGVIHIVLYDEKSLEIKNDDTLLDTQRDIWMYYGRNTGHGHKDTLNIGVHAYGLDISPDLGYPEETGPQPNRMEWVSNTISHNTVVVDESKQNDIYVGTPIHFDDSDMVDVMDIDAKEAYPQTDMYRRTTAMIKVDDEISYGVDFFRIKGGNDHHYSFHGYEGPVTTEGLNLVGQKNEDGNFVGTYAGVDTEYGIRPNDDNGTGWDYMGNGFHWLKNVEKDTAPDSKFSIDWDIVDGRKVLDEEMDIHLRLTMLGEYDDVAIMDGEPPKIPGNPESLKYMIAHRSGEELNSIFTAVIEPYKDTRYIESIDEVSVTVNGEPTAEDVKAVKVVLKNGRTDYIVNSLDTDTVYTVDDKFQFKGFLGVYSEKNGYPVYAYVNDGEKAGEIIEDAQARISGEVVDFTDDFSMSNEIVIKVDEFDMERLNIDDLAGRYIYIENDGVRNASYRIEGVKAHDGNNITLDVGGVTLIRSLADPSDLSKGYLYNINRGARFTIPLSISKAVSLRSINALLEEYISSGDVVGPLIPQLTNSLTQAQHHFDKGSIDQTVKHLENFIKHLNNTALQENITDRSRGMLDKYVNALIGILQE